MATLLHKLGLYTLTIATVTLAGAPAFAASAVRVECNGSCSTISLGQICDRFGTLPIAIACDERITFSSTITQPCGAGLCRGHVDFNRNQLLGDFCRDGSGWDAVVTCN